MPTLYVSPPLLFKSISFMPPWLFEDSTGILLFNASAIAFGKPSKYELQIYNLQILNNLYLFFSE